MEYIGETRREARNDMICRLAFFGAERTCH